MMILCSYKTFLKKVSVYKQSYWFGPEIYDPTSSKRPWSSTEIIGHPVLEISLNTEAILERSAVELRISVPVIRWAG
jgi:hypothetical protein